MTLCPCNTVHDLLCKRNHNHHTIYIYRIHTIYTESFNAQTTVSYKCTYPFRPKKVNKHYNYTLVIPEILTNNVETTQFICKL